MADCENCQKAMSYRSIEVALLESPADPGIHYQTIKSEPGDVPK